MVIALIAHDSRKSLLSQFCFAYAGILSRHTLIATGVTGRRIEEETGLHIERCLAGSKGGAEQLTSRIACGEVDMLLFFRDPLYARAEEPNEHALLRVCDLHGVPAATNIATAEMLIHGLENGDLAWREVLKGEKKQIPCAV